MCAVSGGPDSLALLALACAAGLVVTAVHVDHGLRPGSAGEADVVRRAAVRFGASFEAVAVVVEHGPNLEARARAARRAALPPETMTGHTADDQAETVLLNLLRGSGLGGLAGMRAGVDKPILALRRAETHQLCADLGLVPVTDPTNLSPVHRRNRVRHELLPLADAIAARDVVAVVARQAAHLRADDDLLEDLALAIDAADARAVAAAPAPLAHRALRRLVREQTGEEHPPSAAAIERMMAVVRGEREACEITTGWRVGRTEQRLWVRKVGPPERR